MELLKLMKWKFATFWLPVQTEFFPAPPTSTLVHGQVLAVGGISIGTVDLSGSPVLTLNPHDNVSLSNFYTFQRMDNFTIDNISAAGTHRFLVADLTTNPVRYDPSDRHHTRLVYPIPGRFWVIRPLLTGRS